MALKKKYLGELLIEAGAITPEQRDEALRQQRRLGKRLGEVLVELGYLTEERLAHALSEQLGLPYIDLRVFPVNQAAVNLIPEEMARRLKVLPVDTRDGRLTLAMADPLDVFAADRVRKYTALQVEPAVASARELQEAIARYYRAEGAEEPIRVEQYSPPAALQAEEEEAAPVVKLVNSIVNQAVRARASDVHIEPEEEGLRVRFRIDGILHEAMRPPAQMHPGIVSRVKILAGMDIAEKRLPQDGSFSIQSNGKVFDVRVSTLPTPYGEKVVLRLLEKTTGLPELQELGFSPDTLQSYERLIRRPYGFILSTGPTGSGKTTTMYASLKTINTLQKNIITIEDPIEYSLKGITQVQVNPKIGLSFANGLRSILRQDPDVIMVGEIRDLETASIATHAALTGHLVLSTLHTNEAVGAVARLIDMGVEPFLIASSLVGVLSQRLVRKVCPHCREPLQEVPPVLGELSPPEPLQLFRGRGCQESGHGVSGPGGTV